MAVKQNWKGSQPDTAPLKSVSVRFPERQINLVTNCPDIPLLKDSLCGKMVQEFTLINGLNKDD